MDEFIKTIQKNKRVVFIVLSVLMIVFFAFCPVCEILGKARPSGLELVFKGKGMGVSRWLALVMIVSPIVILIKQFATLPLKKNLQENLEQICFLVSVCLFILFAIVLGSGISLAFGSYLYLLFALAGVVVCYMPKVNNDKIG